MSFPLNGDASQIKIWLRSQNFSEEVVENFTKFCAKAMLGMNINIVKKMVSDEKEAKRLFLLVRDARKQLKGKSSIAFSITSI